MGNFLPRKAETCRRTEIMEEWKCPVYEPVHKYNVKGDKNEEMWSTEEVVEGGLALSDSDILGVSVE